MTIRTPAVAGRFYESTDAGLREQIEASFTHELGPGSVPTVETGPRRLRGLLAPHAGYQFSGPVAAHGYATLAGDGRPDAAVVVGPNHSSRGAPVAVSPADAWETPLGSVDVADGLRERLLAADVATEDAIAHADEHSVEVHLPFLQYCYPDLTVLPVVMSRQDPATSRELGVALADLVSDSDEDVVVVASTDLTHYEPHEIAVERDEIALDAIDACDVDRLYDGVENEGVTMCGYGPTAALMTAARQEGATDVEQYTHATSADVGGDPTRVVGYAAAGFAERT